jgi:hypothetical protein
MRASTAQALGEFASDRARDAKLAVIDRRHVRRTNCEAVERLRREIVGDHVRQYWDARVLAAYRARALGHVL